jgi:hypothetical protein
MHEGHDPVYYQNTQGTVECYRACVLHVASISVHVSQTPLCPACTLAYYPRGGVLSRELQADITPATISRKPRHHRKKAKFLPTTAHTLPQTRIYHQKTHTFATDSALSCLHFLLFLLSSLHGLMCCVVLHHALHHAVQKPTPCPPPEDTRWHRYASNSNAVLFGFQRGFSSCIELHHALHPCGPDEVPVPVGNVVMPLLLRLPYPARC